MCGFVGLLSFRRAAGAAVDAVASGARLAEHRGPDGEGRWNDDDVAMAFHRLAIVDPGGSDQPLQFAGGRYTVVFNGEIYNFRRLREELVRQHDVEFATAGEAETIAAAFAVWGPAAFARLRGMFALLIWDRVARVLVAARDPFGIKPLHVLSGPTGIAFASEKKSLLGLVPQLGRTDALDPDALRHYLLLQYVPEPATMHRAVRKVESGTYLRVDADGRSEVTRYFTPVFGGSRSGPAARRTITEALTDSVSAHLQSDVPVGALLSGGIDSTAIAALAARQVPDLLTFTVGFDDPGYSEIDLAAASAAALGVRHVTRTVTAQEVAEALPLIVWHLDDPVADPALVPLWFVAREAREHVAVVLSGEGADELFGGYAIYHEPRSLAPFERLPGAVRAGLGRVSRHLPEGMRGKDLLRRGALSLEERYSGNARVFRTDQLAAILRAPDARGGSTSVTDPHYARSRTWDPVSRMQHLDLFTWLRGDILVKADRMTMAHSLELRVPFLDPAVFAAASVLAPSEKLAGGRTKVALRQALVDVVPPDVAIRPKLGFPVPVGRWFRGELHPWARDIISSSRAGHLIDLDAALELLAAHRRGPVDHGRRLWAIVVFLVWHALGSTPPVLPTGAEAAAAA